MLLEVGRITKPHGLRGEVLVAFSSDRTDRLSNGSVLLSDRGVLTVVSATPHQDRWIVQFEEILDRTEAETWRGVVLRGEAPDPGELDGAAADELWVHELIGCSVELPDGSTVGEVESVQANPAADLLVLDGGALVPVVFVTDRAPGRIVIDPPDGLLDL